MSKIKFILLFFILSLFPCFTFAEVDLLVSPIKYEYKLDPGESIVGIAKIRNRGEEEVYVTTGKINATAKANTSEPELVEVGNPNQELANWITLNLDSLTLAPLQEYTIQFQIKVPEDATPGGHYGAVYFRYDAKENGVTSETLKSVNVRINYAILILVQVNGDIIEEGSTEGTIIGSGQGGRGGMTVDEIVAQNTNLPLEGDSNNQNGNTPTGQGTGKIEEPIGGYKIDDCPYGDFSKSNFDGKCFDKITLEDLTNYISKYYNNDSGEGNNDEKIILETEENFGIDFNVPFVNNGNTHLKPKGQIVFLDEDGNQLKGIGTENILDENGFIVGEKITDYLPINPEGSNVIPKSKRHFIYLWRGFPYETRDEKGKIVIKYQPPSEYYSDSKTKKPEYIYPRQRIFYRLEKRKINVVMDLEYQKSDGEIVPFNSADEFELDYLVKDVGIDIYFFIFLFIFLLILFILFLILKRLGKKKCPFCGKTIKKDMKICPYCGAKLDKKKK